MFITRKEFERYRKDTLDELRMIRVWNDKELNRVRTSYEDLHNKYNRLLDHLHLKEIQVPSSYKLVPAEEEQKK